MFKEDHLSFRQRKYMKVKNIIGRALGGIGLVVLSPVYLAIIVAIKKEDGITAPVFFSQKRVGIHKEYFNLYKFRSMRTDTPHDKPTHLLENPDQYITKVGHFLRKSSLDELPQLWNIARGDMAVIGPRPALWNQDDLIAERDKYGANDVKPGLTGWAQINGRDELEIPVKARLDGEYVKKMGPLMDIRCFIGTVFSVLRSDGVVEGGTGAKKKLMVITNHSYDKVHFLYLGRIMKEKGMDELFYAVKELQRKEVPFVLDLVGFFEDEYKEKIDKLVDAGIAVFHGFQEDPRPYYAMADCVVLPSYHEGMSNVLLEAAATGRPVITSNIPGCKEAVDDGKSGLLCEAEDWNDLYRKMSKIARMSRIEREAMGVCGRDKMAREFDKDKVVKKTIQGIERV